MKYVRNNMSKKYTICFDVWGLILFLVIMLPNFIWSVIPAPNDILRAESVTKSLDMVASVCQVIMIFALCAFINRNRKKLGMTPLIIGVLICCLLYFAGWMFYYQGVTSASVILLLTIPPCIAFLLFALDRKNMLAVVPNLIFTVCHFVYAVLNFILR